MYIFMEWADKSLQKGSGPISLPGQPHRNASTPDLPYNWDPLHNWDPLVNRDTLHNWGPLENCDPLDDRNN